MTKIYLGSDHAGFKLKEEVKKYLEEINVDFEDLSPDYEEGDDYPDHAVKVCKKVINTEDKGILICGTGIGMSIAANKFPGIRAALCNHIHDAELSRQHNKSNILVLEGFFITEKEAREVVRAWLITRYEGGRHDRRLKKIEEIEKNYLSK